MNGTDVVAVRVIFRRAADGAFAVGEAESIRRVVESVDLLEAFPDWIALLVPGELVGINQSARRQRANDDPGQKPVARGESQVACGLPAAAAGIVEPIF